MNHKVTKSVVVLSALMAAVPVYAEQTSSQPLSPRKKGNGIQVEKSSQVQIPQDLKPMVPNDILRKKSSQQVQDNKQSEFNGKKVSSVSIVGSQSIAPSAFAEHLSIRKGGTFSEENLEKDSRMIYMTGYYMAVNPIVTADGDDAVNVVYQVKNNPAYKGLQISGTTKLDVEQLPALLGLRVGEPVNMKTVGTNLHILDEQYKKMGYILFSVTGMNMTDDGILHLTFNEGIVESIQVQGNKHTKNYVIERELRQPIDEPLNQALIQRSVQRLQALGLFDDVQVQVVQGHDPNKVGLVFNVDEANTATIGVGTSYSESDKFVGEFTITDRNFLGTGDSIGFKWEFGGKDNKNYDFNYTRPYLDKKGTSMSVHLYDSTHESAEYDRNATEIARYDKKGVGQEITFSRADSDYTRNYITIRNHKDTYVEPESGYSKQYFEDSYNDEYYAKYGVYTTAEERRKQNFGTTRSITFTRTFDNRDNPRDPSTGKRNDISFEIAGFGGDFNYRKLSYEQRYYWSMGPKSEKRPRHVLALDLAAGYAWGDMPLSRRFRVGGSSTLRGYEDSQFRGNSMLRGSLEYRIPVSKKFSFVTFVDTGYAWDKRDESAFDLKKMKVGYGIGCRFQTPLGPVKLDYGFGKNEEGRRKGRFHFSFGTSF